MTDEVVTESATAIRTAKKKKNINKKLDSKQTLGNL